MAPTGPTNEDDDAALGIGRDDEDATVAAAPSDIASLLADPRFAAMIDTIVAQRVASMGAAPAQQGGMSPEFVAFLNRMEAALGARDEQRQGYAKPLTPDEIKSRKEGNLEMLALIDEVKRDGVWPEYLIGDGGFHGPSPAGPILYPAGRTIHWRGPPAENFKPLNESAMKIYAAQKKWIGETVSVDQLLAQAVSLARGGEAIPETALVRTGAEDIRVVDTPLRDMTPKRAMATDVVSPSPGGGAASAKASHPALRPPGAAGQAPQGPTYVEAA